MMAKTCHVLLSGDMQTHYSGKKWIFYTHDINKIGFEKNSVNFNENVFSRLLDFPDPGEESQDKIQWDRNKRISSLGKRKTGICSISPGSFAIIIALIVSVNWELVSNERQCLKLGSI